MGKYSIREVLLFTWKFFPTRFQNLRRDVLKKIVFTHRVLYDLDKNKKVGDVYRVTTYSYPQYYPYRRSGQRRQRRVQHHYDIFLEMDRLSVDTKNWKIRVGSHRKWVKNPPPSMIRSATNPKALYLDVGDYNAMVLGINGDFYFRQATAFYLAGHLYGRLWTVGENRTPFFGKHDLRLLEELIRRKFLSF